MRKKILDLKKNVFSVKKSIYIHKTVKLYLKRSFCNMLPGKIGEIFIGPDFDNLRPSYFRQMLVNCF